MGLYDRLFPPRLIDFAMRNREVTRYRAELVPRARGVVVEIGAGSGLNFPFYSSEVTRVLAVEPSAALVAMAAKHAQAIAARVEFSVCSGEALPFADASADTVVTTFTLCTIPNAVHALREARRVLKPGGKLLFAEHGLAAEPSVRRWQARLNPVWSRIAGGCNLDRPIDALVREAGFEIRELRTEYARGPKPMTYMYVGAGVRPR